MFSKSQQPRVILVTGSNKGIGFELVKSLSNSNDMVLLGCRNPERGNDALIRLGSPPNVHCLQLDVSSEESIVQAKNEIEHKYGGQLDILVNNAACGDLELTVDSARKTFSVNYYGIKMLNEYLFPLIRKNGRIINVASACGSVVLSEASKYLQDQYSLSTLTTRQLNQLVEDFISSVGTNNIEQLGYNPQSLYLIYSVSKAAVIALTRIEARQWSSARGILVFSVCPGFCATDINQNAPGGRHPKLGAESILYLINTDENKLENGGFYRDGQQLAQIGRID
ncbi:unnamed protein product [Adineta ricciae]|uniref:Uncharacterized protein n=1 Tax=Adineta ricciae TaxID=249248 RepID=A0A815C7X7_ADIRI|nr:unnamed protein product [Adineta ricciae]CAF1594875.1 unnamed protein product [Adineta ricciae]